MYHTVSVTKIRDDLCVVDIKLAHGFSKSESFKDEDAAIVYARGLVDGFHLAKLALDHGLRWDGSIGGHGD